MSNIKEFKAKPKITRNQMLLDLISSAKEVIDKNIEVQDYLLVAISKTVPCYTVCRTLHTNDDYNPLPMMGALEVTKLGLSNLLVFEEIDSDGEGE